MIPTLHFRLAFILWKAPVFARDGFARPFARAAVGVGPLTAHRQIFAVTQTAVRTHVDVALDARRHLASEIALDLETLIEDLPDLDNVVVIEIVTF